MNGSMRSSRGPVARTRRWVREVRSLAPGRRFETLHERHTDGDPAWWKRAIGAAAAIALIAFGALQLVIPGPGILVILLGAALLSREFRFVARWMDAAEVWTRRVWRASADAWKGASTVSKTLVVGAAAAGVGAAAWVVVVLVLPRL